MATIKSFTDIEQSKKLAEILPLESADMYYFLDPTPAGNIYHLVVQRVDIGIKNLPQYDKGDIPCWSLAALINILAKIANKIDDDGSADLSSFMGQWSVNMFDCPVEATDNYDNPIDACYEMIIKLKESNLL